MCPRTAGEERRGGGSARAAVSEDDKLDTLALGCVEWGVVASRLYEIAETRIVIRP